MSNKIVGKLEIAEELENEKKLFFRLKCLRWC